MIETDWKALHGDSLRGKHVLVTGGAGFIGSHLVEALTALGAYICVYDDFSGGAAANVPDSESIQVIRGSMLDPSAIAHALGDCQIVFHLAARVSVPQSVTNPKAYHDVNGTGTINLLETARAAGVKRIIYSASSSAYGDGPELPKVETMAERPKSPYAAAKLVGEQYVRAYAACYAIDAISLRYFNIFGPRQNPHSPYSGVIAAFSKTILGGEAPRITGDGSASRDFTFVHNAVHANLLAAAHPERLNGEVINIAAGERRTILELADAMLKEFGREDLKPTFAPSRPGDVAHSLASLERAKALIGYAPIVDFSSGLSATCSWYAHQLTQR